MILRCACVLIVLTGLLLPADALAQTDFSKYRQSFYKYRYGKPSKRYKNACGIIRRNQKNNDKFMNRLFRRKSAGGDMQTE